MSSKKHCSKTIRHRFVCRSPARSMGVEVEGWRGGTADWWRAEVGPWVTHAPLHNIKNSHTFLGRQNCPCWNAGVFFFLSNEQHLFYLDRWDVEENSYHRKTPKLPSIYAWMPHWSLLKDILTITQGTPSRERFKADCDTMRISCVVFGGRLQRTFWNRSLVLQPVNFATVSLLGYYS